LHCPTFRGHKKVKLKFLLFQHPQPELHKNHVTQFANKVKRGKIHNEANDNFIQLFDMFLPSIFLVSLIGRSVFDVPLLIIFLLGHAQSEDKFNFIVLRALKKDENLIIPWKSVSMPREELWNCPHSGWIDSLVAKKLDRTENLINIFTF
jgi:hypothetical protein